MDIHIHTDGGARGNPGPAAIGVFVEVEGKSVGTLSEFIGTATNNEAEYTAVVRAFEWLRNYEKEKSVPIGNVSFFIDSTLVAQQLNGRFKVKSAHLREMMTKIRMLEQDMGGIIRYFVIPREQNRRADLLVNQALDKQLYGS